MNRLAGKVALITGAGQGVGQGIAFAMAAAGASVVVAGRTLEKVQRTAAEIAHRGGEALATACDVKSASDLSRVVDECVLRLGGIDILVNNAQEVPLGPLLDVDDEAFLAGFESGPLASFRLMKLVHPHMIGRGGGTMFAQGIRVLTIAPHAESPGLKWWIENNPDEAAAFFKTIPLGRVGKLEEDIGRAVVALCAPEMAYLTGATIPLDGGQANFA
ncbi:MAG: SDR family oxidoreductase [Sphingomonadales bacterium]|nr:SDR family oxidoreductase [Sphingomonadales bacterium]